MAISKQEWVRFFRESREWAEIRSHLTKVSGVKASRALTLSPKETSDFTHEIGHLQGQVRLVQYVVGGDMEGVLKDGVVEEL